ncbi:hypothetical protein ACIPSA_45380 [Streptomyces sp. NPDC086549]|uniref:hypothetical protein n=1 Tax=Streptomyces sp. NPDC086549 TaxID=3365752 RepID=UPI0038272A56
MYGPQGVATPSTRINGAAVAALVFTVIAALCALAARMLASQANAVHDETSGVLSLLTLAASFIGALPAVVLGVCGVATRKGTRGLGLAIASLVLAGGWVLFGVVIWIGLATGILR